MCIRDSIYRDLRWARGVTPPELALVQSRRLGFKGSTSVQTANEGRSSPPPLPPSDEALREATYEPQPAVADDARYSMETRLLRTLMHAFGNPPIAFSLWNGDKIAPLGTAPVATLKIADRRTLLRLCTDPDLQFGELYSCLLYTSPS